MSLLRKGTISRRGGKPVPVLIDSYYVETPTSDLPYNDKWLGSGYVAFGITFKPSVARRLASCKFRLRKIGDPIGNLRVYLYAHSGTFGSNGVPTGSPIHTSKAVDLTTLTISYALYRFTFDRSYILQVNTPYCLAVYSTDGTLPRPNGLEIAGMLVGTHEGNPFGYSSGWFSFSPQDIMFYVYGV